MKGIKVIMRKGKKPEDIRFQERGKVGNVKCKNMSILRKIKNKTGKKEGSSKKVKERCGCHHLFLLRKVCLSPFPCLRVAAIMTLQKAT